MIRAGTILAFLLISAMTLVAQPRLSVDRTEALIGDHIILNLAIPGASPEDWINSDILPADTVASVQVISEEQISPNSSNTGITKEWTIAVFDTGYVRIPPLAVILRVNGDRDSFYTNDIPLRISGVTDSLGMAPIKPIIYEEVRFTDYLPYIVGLVLFVLLGLFLWWWSKRPKRVKETKVVIQEIPAHKKAIAALDLLESKELWQKGMIKEYHSELSRILRQYLEERYEVQALESTTSELQESLTEYLDDKQFEQMIRMMRIEDLVKFAKASPPENVHPEHMEFVRAFIEQTIPEEKPVENV